MAKHYIITLTGEEQATLTAVVQQKRVAGTRLVRAQCLLAVARNGLGWTDAQTSQAYAVSTRTLERLRQRACEAGVEAALHGQPRQHWPASKYTGEVEAHLAAAACSTPPGTPIGPCACWPSTWSRSRYCPGPARRWWGGC